MATTTEFLGLTKIEYSDNFDIDLIFNENMEKINNFIEQLNINNKKICFYINRSNVDGTENYNTYDTFEAERGMTWGDFIASDYNSLGKFTGYSSEVYYNGEYINIALPNHNSSYVSTVEPIQPWHKYTLGVCCFEAGTEVSISLEDLSITKNIEDIKIGDMIVSYNEETKEFYLTSVINTPNNPNVTNVAEITLNNNYYLRMNAYHPILTVEGYKSLTNYNNLPLLTEKDIIITTNGEQSIKEIKQYTQKEELMYNLSVEGKDHNFIANGMVVHNAGCK